MATQFTLHEILEKAIEREIESQLLYRDLSQKMKDPAARDAFQELVRQEEGHQNLLEKYLRGELKEGALGRRHVLNYKIAEHLDQPELSPDMELKDVFLLAANREKASHEFYLSFSRLHPPGEVKKLLEELASQELAHKQRVEFLYTEVAFPQTAGG
ncbi:MAG: ferritin family protein [Dehalococcoidales bacterium]|nr:ferritin family protein [Dehalococcoidales bacterium]